MMYLVAWIASQGDPCWAWVFGEQERDVFVDDLVNTGIAPEDIHVFSSEDEIS